MTLRKWISVTESTTLCIFDEKLYVTASDVSVGGATLCAVEQPDGKVFTAEIDLSTAEPEDCYYKLVEQPDGKVFLN